MHVGPYAYCRCDVEGTSPGTPYTYTVSYSSDGGAAANASYVATTKTPAPLVPFGQTGVNFSFLFFSDPHGHAEDMPTMQAIADAMGNENANFGIGGGDVGERGEMMMSYLLNTYKYSNQSGLLSRVPFYMAVGNHDWWGEDNYCAVVGSWECDPGWPRLLMLQGGSPFATRPAYGDFGGNMGLLKSSPGWQYRYFSFDYGNSHFTVLDSGLHSRFDVGGTWIQPGYWSGKYDLDSDQLVWATNDLYQAHLDPRIRHKFVILHEPPYDTQGDMVELIANPDIQYLPGSYPNVDLIANPILENAMQQFGVQMVLAGHRHHYEHLTANGIHYVTCSGSANYDTDTSPDDDTSANVVDWSENCGGYCRIDIGDDGVTVTRKEVSHYGTLEPTPITVNQFNLGHPTPAEVTITPVMSNLDVNYQINWYDNSINETSYIIERSTDPTFPTASTTQFNGVTDGNFGHNVGPLSYLDPATPAIPDGTEIYYRVRGYYYGDNTLSAPVVVHVYKGSGKVEGIKDFAYATPPQVHVYWADISTSGFGPVDHYEVQRKGCAGNWSQGCMPNAWSTVNASNQTNNTWFDDFSPTCAKMTYRVRAVYSVFKISEWSDEVTYDGTTTYPCGPSSMRANGVSPSTMRVQWTNDTAQGASPGGSVILQSSPDASTWTTASSGTADSFHQVDVPVTSSCTSTASTYFRVAAYDSVGNPHYGPVVKAQPSQCMGTPTLSAVAGGNRLTLNIDYQPPKQGGPAPDKWVLYRRISGEVGFGTARRILLQPGTTTVSETDPDVSCEASYDYQVRGFYSGGSSYFPDGAPTELSPIVTVHPSCGACANGAAADQIFSPGMVGCGGSVTWDQRDSLCAPGYAACTAAEWVANEGGSAPTDDYWTDDNLSYAGSGPNACQADTSGGYSCGTNRPMRVCTRSGNDTYGNTCTWTGCGLNSTTNQYFGGCVSNPTAGTLCCKRAQVCGPNAAAVQTFAPGVAGCAGHVGYLDRNSLCGSGCRACTSSEFKTHRSGIVPAHDYWTDDELGYLGTGANACGASTSGNSCGATTPMRVCTPSGTDSEGNVCNWTGCALGTTTPLAPNDYFGGCVGDNYAGTLCCCDR
jgi:hypothetical protein